MTQETVLDFLSANGFNRKELAIIKDEKEMLLSLVKAVTWSSQLQIIEHLYNDKFLPEAKKLDQDSILEIKKYEHDFDIDIPNNSHAFFETIRFGYISMYHKLENCRQELVDSITSIFQMDEKTFLKLYKERFHIEFKKPKNGIIYKFSWIADCTKHQNAIASNRNNPPEEFIDYPTGKRIEIGQEQFKTDSEKLRLGFKNLCMTSVLIGAIHELKI